MNLSKDICSEGGDLRAVSGPKIRAWSRHPRSGPPPPKKNKENANIEATKKGRRDSRSGYNLSRSRLPGSIWVQFVPDPFGYNLSRAHFWYHLSRAPFGTVCTEPILVQYVLGLGANSAGPILVQFVPGTSAPVHLGTIYPGPISTPGNIIT